MESIEERASEYAHTEWISEFTDVAKESYTKGATEQKAIDEEEIKQLHSIMEKSASVLGIGTKWLNEDARLKAVTELKEMILDYLSD